MPLQRSNTNFTCLTFTLAGVRGLDAGHLWQTIPFSSIYLVALEGNCTILFIIKMDPSLHEPMYYFLSMLALADLGLSLCTMPTVLSILWLNSRQISAGACFTQFYFIHTFSFLESSVLLAMAFDRYVAICHPLRYASILTSSRIAKIGLAILGRCVFIVMPGVFVLRKLPFCRSHALSHSYCLHQDLMKLVCADITFNIVYGLSLAILIFMLDSLLIFASYILIFKTILSIASREECLKALNNCLSHIFAVLILYIPMAGVSIVHRFGQHTSPVVHVLMANVYLLVPPVMNPIIYSIKTKQIRQGILRLFSLQRTYGTWPERSVVTPHR
ncbi:olfactory receptor 51Q1-like [Alligator sinensis]|uniref:Olfactory receptor n=1 Tax=Alligator sinensis TaxID=38654 RepID=A0A1U8DXI5_ALLSI|nr:olfactory receptor 51Q1-like [Alligator sinensis]